MPEACLSKCNIENKLASLRSQLEQKKADTYITQGAVFFCEALIAEMDKPADEPVKEGENAPAAS